MSTFVVWWMKKDLRLQDNGALAAAHLEAQQKRCPLLALWIDEPEATAAPEDHPRRQRFVYECLAELQPELTRLGVVLCVAQGSAEAVFGELAALGMKAVFSHEETGLLWTYKRDLCVKKIFRHLSIEWHETPTNGVVRLLKSRDEWHARYQSRMNHDLLLKPTEPLSDEKSLSSMLHERDGFEGKFLIWGSNAHKAWAERMVRWKNRQQRGGEQVALALMARFLQPHIHRKYLSSISKPKDSQTFSSRLSPYLAYGCISSRQILNQLQHRPHEHTSWDSRALSAMRSRLAWRCHFMQKLENFPNMEESEQNSALQGIRPEMSSEEFEHWHLGKTGYPLVDACLRSVHSTGFLNFRMRAMLMSFATHLMWRDWRAPAWDLARAFLDFEPGIHFAQVQMQASVTGNNQIRIYNPLKQSEENDPDALFIKEWVPELRDVSVGAIHTLRGLPSTYPQPIVDLSESMAFARENLFKRFAEERVRKEARQVQEKLGSRNRPSARKKKTPTGARKSRKNDVSEITLFDTVDSED